jgi:hypothetical protein
MRRERASKRGKKEKKIKTYVFVTVLIVAGAAFPQSSGNFSYGTGPTACTMDQDGAISGQRSFLSLP